MIFYHKGLRVCKTPLPFVSCDRKAAILRIQIWSAHESDVVGLSALEGLHDGDVICLARPPVNNPPPAMQSESEKVGVAKKGGILLANPEISFYCTIKRFLVDSTKINIK